MPVPSAPRAGDSPHGMLRQKVQNSSRPISRNHRARVSAIFRQLTGHCATNQRTCRYPAGIPRQPNSELRRRRKAALIWAPESAIGDPNFLKKIPWPTPFRFRLDDYGLTLFSNGHFRSVEPVILWKSNGLRPAGGEQFRRIHVDTVSMIAERSIQPRIARISRMNRDPMPKHE